MSKKKICRCGKPMVKMFQDLGGTDVYLCIDTIKHDYLLENTDEDNLETSRILSMENGNVLTEVRNDSVKIKVEGASIRVSAEQFEEIMNFVESSDL